MCNMIVDTLDVIRQREHTYIRFLAGGDPSGSSPAKDHVVPRRPGPTYPVSAADERHITSSRIRETNTYFIHAAQPLSLSIS